MSTMNISLTLTSGQLEVVTSLRSGCALLHGASLLVEMSPSTKLRIAPLSVSDASSVTFPVAGS